MNIIHVLECSVGLMIGTKLVWSRMKKYGKALIITTITQSIATFVIVTLVFSVVFAVTSIPVYLAFLFGGIALATAPAPALSIVREFKTNGPVTRTLIPMAALDDIVPLSLSEKTISTGSCFLSGLLSMSRSIKVVPSPSSSFCNWLSMAALFMLSTWSSRKWLVLSNFLQR